MLCNFVSVLLFLSCCCAQSGAFVVPVRPTSLSVAPKEVNNFLSAPKFRVSTILQEAQDPVEQSVDALTVDQDHLFNGRTTLVLVGGQSVLVGVAAVAALVVGTPNFGLGPGINFSVEPLVNGALWVVPLGVCAYVLDLAEERVSALQDVTKATQRSVLALLGGKWKPIIAVATASALGLAAGIGEEMLFRGVLQYELATRFGEFASVTVTSIIFGALHAVTPLYALLASLASVYFGWLYTSSGNLAVPIATHTLYDAVALLYCHWTVTQMTEDEQMDIAEWQGPMDPN
jgi:membrane protease YdiL (CAAX protease family)